MRRRRKVRKYRGYPKTFTVSPTDALLFSGFTALVSLAMGASPNKALDYGIACLRACGAQFEIIEEDEDDRPFMVGLA